LNVVATMGLVKFLALHENDIANERGAYGDLRLVFWQVMKRWPRPQNTGAGNASASEQKEAQ
jgi:hypothetical protein